MSYRIIDVVDKFDIFSEDFDTKEEAIRKASVSWSKLSDHDKKRRTSYVILGGEEDKLHEFDYPIIAAWKFNDVAVGDEYAPDNIDAYFNIIAIPGRCEHVIIECRECHEDDDITGKVYVVPFEQVRDNRSFDPDTAVQMD